MNPSPKQAMNAKENHFLKALLIVIKLKILTTTSAADDW